MSNIELLIKQVLRAAAPYNIVVDAKLPGEVALHARLERRARDLQLCAAAGDEAGAGDDGMEGFEGLSEGAGGVVDEVAGDDWDGEAGEGCEQSGLWGRRGGGGGAEEDADGGAVGGGVGFEGLG